MEDMSKHGFSIAMTGCVETSTDSLVSQLLKQLQQW